MDEELKNKYKKEYAKFKKYLHIQGMEELRDLIVSLRTNEKIKNLSNIDIFWISSDIENAIKDNIFIHNAIKGLEQSFFSFNYVDQHSLISLYQIIYASLTAQCCYTLSNREMTNYISSELFAKIILAQDNFNKLEDIPLLSIQFFQKFRKLKKGKGVRKLNNFIYRGYLDKIQTEYDINILLYGRMSVCAEFLAACYTFKDNRKIVTTEDLIKGWNLTLKLLITDLRPYVFNQESKFYNSNIDFRKYRKDISYRKYEEDLIKSLDGFSKYSHITHMDELKNAFINLRDNEKYIYLSSAKDRNAHTWFNKYEKNAHP